MLHVIVQGNVENWLADLLKMSRASVHDIIRSATISIADPSFKLLDFENSYAAQVSKRVQFIIDDVNLL
jgi:dynein heavy chain, axonemal